MSNKQTEYEASRALLLDKGVKFTVEGTNLFFKPKKRAFTFKQSYFGTLFELSKLYNKIEVNDSFFDDENWLSTSKKLLEYAPVMARIIAVSYLNSKWKIRLFSGVLARYFMWKLKPSETVKLCKMIAVDLNNMQDFIITIKLLSISPMTAKKSNLSPDDNGG